MKLLREIVDLKLNDRDFVILEVKEGHELDLIMLGFNGNEKMFRMSKSRHSGGEHDYTIFHNDGKSFSFSTNTLKSDGLRHMMFKINECITGDFGIFVSNDSDYKINETLGYRNPKQIKRKLKVYKGDGYYSIYINNQRVTNARTDEFRDLDEWLKKNKYELKNGYLYTYEALSEEIKQDKLESLNTMDMLNDGYKIERSGETIVLTKNEMRNFLFYYDAYYGRESIYYVAGLYEEDSDEYNKLMEMSKDMYACYNIRQSFLDTMLSEAGESEREVVMDYLIDNEYENELKM